MRELARLLVEVKDSDVVNSYYKVDSWLADGTSFEIAVPYHKVKLIDKSDENLVQKGWMEVVFSGEDSSKRASIELPAPSLVYGNRVTVSTKHIMRENAADRRDERDSDIKVAAMKDDSGNLKK
ncbi:MAG: hypothetical protein ACW99G_19690 [Candidatus Thorarchaeota archaeon]|jgi:hypothetical protein